MAINLPPSRLFAGKLNCHSKSDHLIMPVAPSGHLGFFSVDHTLCIEFKTRTGYILYNKKRKPLQSQLTVRTAFTLKAIVLCFQF